MAKKQTRRSVSIRGATYDRIRQFCERSGTSMSEFVEMRIADFFTSGGSAPVERPPVTVTASTVKKQPAPAPKPAPPAVKARSRPANGKAQSEEEKLDFDEMQNAARFFTF